MQARLSEAHHRIANNLALIAGFVRLQASGVARENRALSATEGRRLLEEISVRVEMVGRLHRQLSARPLDQRIDVGDFLKETCEVLASTISQDSPRELRCEAHACEIESDRAGLLSLIVTELVTNAVKYAHPAGAPGRIDVRCRGVGQELLQITVADDGVGLPDGFDPDVDGGLGLRVVRSLATQLGAEVGFDSDGLGLTVTLTLSLGRPTSTAWTPRGRAEA
jgi:two-component sensor histidine kinase